MNWFVEIGRDLSKVLPVVVLTSALICLKASVMIVLSHFFSLSHVRHLQEFV